MVSIVIPVFNKIKYVEQMINSIRDQSYQDFELLLIDDGSTDGVIELMNHYQSFDSRIHLIPRNREPKGAQTCRNIGLKFANNKYIVFFDSDDLISKNCLRDRVNFMESNPLIDFGVFPARTFRGEGTLCPITKTDLKWGIKTKNNILLQFLSANYPFLIVTNIYRKCVLEKHDLYWDEYLVKYQDFDFNINAIFKRLEFKFSEDKSSSFDYFYRVADNENSTCRQPTTKSSFESTIYLFEKVIQNLDHYHKRNEYHNSFFNYIKLYVKYLIKESKFEFIPILLLWCGKHYSKYKIQKLNFIFHIAKKDIGRPYHKFFFVFLLCLLFPKTELISRISQLIKFRS